MGRESNERVDLKLQVPGDKEVSSLMKESGLS